jgi:hypothetical protein
MMMIHNDQLKKDTWVWTHDANIAQILQRCVSVGVPLQHSLLKLTRSQQAMEAS